MSEHIRKFNPVQYSIDIETLGQGNDSYIIAIGCAAFNIETGSIIDTFYKNTFCGNGFSIDVDTVFWWLEQKDEPRLELVNKKESQVYIHTALADLANFILDHDNAQVWGNGSIFDIGVLEHAYKVCKLSPPWHFRNILDMRTIVNVARVKGFNRYRTPFTGVHNALADATQQALVISEAYNMINNGTYLDGELEGTVAGSDAARLVHTEKICKHDLSYLGRSHGGTDILRCLKCGLITVDENA